MCMCLHVGEVTISVREHTSGREVSRSSFLRKGDAVIAGHRFIIATIEEHCVFTPVDREVRSTLEDAISMFLAQGVCVIKKNGNIVTPVHVYISVPVTDIWERFDIGTIGLDSIQIRYNAVLDNQLILVKRCS